jgi:polyribonucleotide nucleotidyltransferase
MNKEMVRELTIGGSKLILKTGLLACQADAAVMACMGDTHVLCTVTASKEAKEDLGFFPLTVNYREMTYAAGKIPGGFIKREGRQSDRETLISRLIDRPIRPLFQDGFTNETQIICTVLSYDPEHNPDIVALIGASAALAISGIPTKDIIAGIRVGYINDEFVLNHSIAQNSESKLDLVIAATKSSIMMVESEIALLSEDVVLKALEFGHNNIIPIVNLIEDLKKDVNKNTIQVKSVDSSWLENEIFKNFENKIKKAYEFKVKQERVVELKKIADEIIGSYKDNTEVNGIMCKIAIDSIKSKILRSQILNNSKRIDGRNLDEIRSLSNIVSLLPRAHGSALFIRGETQALVVTTLGSGGDEQIVDDITGNEKDRFMLHYTFPAYSVGEVGALRGPGRREIGHGKLAHRALINVMPEERDFPYVVRVSSEITSCNGSSSMATICGASLSMMDAGIPIKSHVAGIAMGLIIENGKYSILSDIISDEDALGDMDFKIAGTRDAITALQMDIKVGGVTIQIMKEAMSQAKKGLAVILDSMEQSITEARSEKSKYAPAIRIIKINPEKIREVIGSGGKVIQDICEKSSAKIDIEKDGTVKVAAVGHESLQKAIDMISAITEEPEMGKIYSGKVVKIIESGAFVNYMGSKDGFLHISKISEEMVDDIQDFIKEGQVVSVRLIEIDDKGKSRLSMLLDKEYVNTHKKENKPPFKTAAKRKNETPSAAAPYNKKRYDNNNPASDKKVERKYFD